MASAPERVEVEAVELFRLVAVGPSARIADVGGQDRAGSVAIRQAGGQLGPDLPGSAGDEDALHVVGVSTPSDGSRG